MRLRWLIVTATMACSAPHEGGAPMPIAVAPAPSVKATPEVPKSRARAARGMLWRHFACRRGEPNDDLCVGLVRGRAVHVAEVARIAAGPTKDVDDDILKDAGWLDVTEAIPHLRAIVARAPRPDEEKTHEGLELTLHRAAAATALADLDDHASGPLVVDLLRWTEEHNVGFSYREALEALSRIDREALGRYVLDAFARLRGNWHVRELVPWMKVAGAAAREPLARATGAYDEIPISAAHDYCELMAARLAAGDPELNASVRKQARGPYSGTWLATCDASWLGAVLGEELGDGDILLRHLGRPDLGMDHGIARIAYERLVGYLARIAKDASALAQKERATILAGLRERARWPHVADPTHRNYAPKMRAAHLAALAALGDAEGLTTTRAMIDDAKDESGAATWAAVYAVGLGVPGADEHAYALLARQTTFRDADLAGGRERLVEALATKGDVRWTAALVSAEANARRRAIAHLVRTKPAGACAVVARLAPQTTDEAAEDAWWALSALGDACGVHASDVARDASLRPAVRGMGLELSAMLRLPFVRSFAAAQAEKKESFYVAFVQRAQLIDVSEL